MKFSNFKRRQRGQAIIEYIILVVVIALLALVVLVGLSDRIKDMINGVTTTLGGEAVQTDNAGTQLQNLDEGGLDLN